MKKEGGKKECKQKQSCCFFYTRSTQRKELAPPAFARLASVARGLWRRKRRQGKHRTSSGVADVFAATPSDAGAAAAAAPSSFPLSSRPSSSSSSSLSAVRLPDGLPGLDKDHQVPHLLVQLGQLLLCGLALLAPPQLEGGQQRAQRRLCRSE